MDDEDAQGPRGSFLASSLSRTHLGFLLGHLALRDWDPPDLPAPDWMQNPSEQRTKTMRLANAIQSFADTHAPTTVVPVYLPADVYASAGRAESSPLNRHLSKMDVNPWEDNRLQKQILTALSGLDPIDLTAALSEESAFLEGDYHLSPTGHQRVASAITAALEQRSPSAEPSSVTKETTSQ